MVDILCSPGTQPKGATRFFFNRTHLRSPQMSMSPAPEAKGFTEEEAGHIGWNFVSKYYESYNTNIDVLYSMYAPQSLLSHARFPHGDSTTPKW